MKIEHFSDKSFDTLLERRFHAPELEIRSKGPKLYIEGYAAVFNARSQNLGGFVEVVKPSAFTKSLQEGDIRALLNHDPNRILARNKSKTLELSTDSSGLHYRFDPPDTSYARDLLVSMDRGDVNQSSFAFINVEDAWDLNGEEFPERSLKAVRLIDISVVTYPAYLQTSSQIARNAALAGLAKRAGCEVGDLCNVDVIRRAVQGQPIPNAEIAAVRQAVKDERIPGPSWTQRAELMKELEQALRDEQLLSHN